MSATAYQIFVGIDWGSREHYVVVLNRDGTVVQERRVAHTAEAIDALVEWLGELADDAVGERVAVALEVPRGALVEACLERGFHVYALNPKQLDRFRDRYTVAGAKDDRRDAQVLASALRTDAPAFRRLDPEDDRVVEIRELSRLDDDLSIELRRLSNRLRAQVHRVMPQLLTLCPGADQAWFWTLLARATTATAAAHLPRAAVARILRQHRIRRLTPDDVVAALRVAPVPAPRGVRRAVEAQLGVLLPRLRLAAEQQARCAARLEALLEELDQKQEHRDVAILRSLPGVGRKVSATMLAEASRPLAARDYHALRTQAGSAPITKQSGQRRFVMMRQACNGRLRNAVHYWAQTNVLHDAVSAKLYARLRARGCSHGRALRGVADRLLALLVAMLRTQTLYDPSRRQNLRPAA
jgi:transposase